MRAAIAAAIAGARRWSASTSSLSARRGGLRAVPGTARRRPGAHRAGAGARAAGPPCASCAPPPDRGARRTDRRVISRRRGSRAVSDVVRRALARRSSSTSPTWPTTASSWITSPRTGTSRARRATALGAGARFKVDVRPGSRYSWGDITLSNVEPPSRIVARGRYGKYSRTRTLLIWELEPETSGTTRVRLSYETEPGILSDRINEALGGRRFWRRRLRKCAAAPARDPRGGPRARRERHHRRRRSQARTGAVHRFE